MRRKTKLLSFIFRGGDRIGTMCLGDTMCLYEIRGSSSKKDSKRNNCVALLRESGVELDVFDAKGVRLISIIITTIFKSSQTK